MKLHEYQGKAILKEEGIVLPESRLTYYPEDAWMVSMEIGCPVMLKAQVLSGNRGKSGGIKKCFDSSQVKKEAIKMFGSKIVTKQSNNQQLKIRKILVEKTVDIKKEFYVSLNMDRETASILIIISEHGGVNIEDLAQKNHDVIKKIYINPYVGFQMFHARTIASFLKINKQIEKIKQLFDKLYKIFISKDCMMLEINPLVLTTSNDIIPVDVKMDIDDNSLFRQKKIARFKDATEQIYDEVEAKFFGLNFIKLEGNIGCMVNGAGLAMATMDFIKQCGGEPANFLDVGGVATPETISKGFEILNREKNLNGIFINIFGRIVRCDKVAKAIIDATNKINISIPIVIRLSGSNLDEGLDILKKSKKNFHIASTVEEAIKHIKKIVNNKQNKEEK